MSALVWKMTGKRDADWDNMKPGEIIHGYRNDLIVGTIMRRHDVGYGESVYWWQCPLAQHCPQGLAGSAREARKFIVEEIARFLERGGMRFEGPGRDPFAEPSTSVLDEAF